MPLKRIRIAIAVEVDVADESQVPGVVKKFMDAVMPALKKVMRRTDTPVLSVNDVA